MANGQINKLLEFASMQMATEAFLSRSGDSVPNQPPEEQLVGRLVQGNTHISRFTAVQAAQFAAQYEVLAQYRNDPLQVSGAGFSGTLFRNRQTGELTLSFRSTEFLDDAVRDGKSTNEFEISDVGWALGQIAEMENWYSELRSNPNLLGGKLFNVTGYSLGGHLATAFNILRIEQVAATGDPDGNPILNTYTFNGAGTGSIRSNGRLTDLLADFHRIKANYQESEEWKAVSILDRPVILAAATDRVEQINSEVSRVAGLNGLKNTNFNNSSAPKGVQASVEYQIAALLIRRKTIGASANIRLGGPLGISAELVQVPVSRRINNLHEIVGMEREGLATSFVSNSGFHYGSRISIPIEGQPYFRGNYLGNLVTESIRSGGLIKLLVDSPSDNDFGDTHSLILLIDSLSLMAAMEGLDPSLTNETALEIFNAASDAAVVTSFSSQGKAEGDTLERVLDALYRLFVDPHATSLVVSRNGNTWHDIEQRAAFHGRLVDLEKVIYGDDGDGIDGKFVLKPLSSRVDASSILFADAQAIKTQAEADTIKGAAWRYALVHLDPFVAEPVSEAVTLPRYQELIYSLYDSETGDGALTDAWLLARAEFLDWKNRDFIADRSKPLRGSLAETILYSDKAIKEFNGNDLTIKVAGRRGNIANLPLNVVFGNQANDTLTGGNNITGDRFFGGGGDDILNGNAGNDYLEGGAGGDGIQGGLGDDTLIGMQGNDILDGGAGSDRLDGGKGDDTFIYRLSDGKAPDVITDVDGVGRIRFFTSANSHTDLSGGRKIGDGLWESEDGKFTYTLGDIGDGSFILHVVHASGGGVIVEDFNPGELGIQLENAPKPVVVPSASGVYEVNGAWAPKLFGESGERHYQFDAVGNVIREVNVPDDPANQPMPDPPHTPYRGNFIRGTTEGDRFFLDGNYPDSTVWAHAGDDLIFGDDLAGHSIYAGPGNDWIEAGRIAGHTGFDWYLLNGQLHLKQGEDILSGGAGNDRIFGESVATLAALYDPSTVATNLPGDWGQGNSGNDEIYGAAGDDVLMGGTGLDRLVGGAGRDVLLGDDDYATWEGQARWRISHAFFGETLPGYSMFDVGFYAGSNVVNTEVNVVRDSAFLGYGQVQLRTGDPEFIYYKNGGGDDELFGGSGKDILIGQLGNDKLYGENDGDVLAGWEGDDLLVGGEGDDYLAGDFGRYEQPNERIWQPVSSTFILVPIRAGSGNALNSDGSSVSQSGADYLDGGAGNDVLYGDGGDDVLIGGIGNDSLTGDGGYLPEELHGADILDGGDGDDFLSGNAGKDKLSGGKGSDILHAGKGDDFVEGGDGNDILNGDDGQDTLYGDKDNDQLSGGEGNDVLYGGFGDDRLDGGAGNDLLVDEQGVNVFIGGGGDDIVIGGVLADLVEAGDGNDVIDAGGGNDVIRGGAGNDTYVLNVGDGNDQIEDAEGESKLEFGDEISSGQIAGAWNGSTLNVSYGDGGDSFSFNAAESGFSEINFSDGTRWSQKNLVNVSSYVATIGTAASDILTGVTYARNQLLGLDGNDQLIGASYDDRLEGGNGDDLLDGAAGADRYVFSADEGGIDTLSDSDTSDFDYFEWYYKGIGINDWSVLLEFGGQYQAVIEEDGGFLTRYFSTMEQALEQYPDAAITYIEPLDPAPVVRRNDTVAINALAAAGVLPLDTVLFGSGICLDDLRLTATAHDDLPGYETQWLSGGGALSVRWADAGFDVSVPDLNYGYNGVLESYALGEGIERFEFSDGSSYTLEQLLDLAALRIDHADGRVFQRGSGDIEFIEGGDGNDILIGRGGDDWLTGAGGNDNLEGGDGNDWIRGDDYWSENFGGAGNDVLIGGAGDDQLEGMSGDDVLNGGAGNDNLSGGQGADRYLFAAGDGQDAINVDEEDVVEFDSSLSSSDISFSRVFGTDLLVSFAGSTDRITFSGWFEDNVINFEPGRVAAGFEFSDGAFLTPEDIASRLQVTLASEADDLIGGTNGDDVINGLDGHDEIYGNGGYDIVRGGTGDDYLETDWLNPSGSSVLDGGLGNDGLSDSSGGQFIAGGQGDDHVWLFGFNDRTVVAFNPGDGHDTIHAYAGMTLSIGGGVTPSDLALAFDEGGSGLVLFVGPNDSIRLSREYEEDTQAWPSITLQLFGSSHLYDFNAAIEAPYQGNEDSLPLGDVLPGLEFAFSETEGLGGLLAETYQRFGNLDALSEEQIRGVLVHPGFGSELQALGHGLALIGGDGPDELAGGPSNDLLDGRGGADSLRGNGGDDRYVVDDAGDIVIEAAQHGYDRIDSSVAYTLPLNVEMLALTGDASINGTGNALNNLLTGNDGNNRLDGRAGADVMRGGIGNDTYVIDNIGDLIEELSDAGTDAVTSSIDYSLGIHLENLSLSGNAINGSGNAAANRLTGNARDNQLRGLGGDDVLNGGAGADTLIGGSGDDTYVIDNATDQVIELAGEGIDIVQSTVSHTLADHVENLTLTGSAATQGYGNSLGNRITGNAADNVLAGFEGNDTLDGKAGADQMAGGLGDDLYIVDQAGDSLLELADEGSDTVNSAVSWVLGEHLEHLTLTGSAVIDGAGNSLNNQLAGNNVANTLSGLDGDDWLDGKGGADLMIGGGGNDTYVVAQSGDVIVEAADGGIDAVRSSITWTLGENIEQLVLTGTANIRAYGNTMANSLAGNTGNNLIDGGLGADLMTGGFGNDTYYVDDAGDQIVELLDQGVDTVRSSVSRILEANVENLVLTGTTAISGTGNALANVLSGNAAANTLSGGDGNDIINGGAGADMLIGGSGNDLYTVDSVGDVVVELADGGSDTVQTSINHVLTANVENLVLTGAGNRTGTGNSLDNIISGNRGSNTLNGGTGNDVLAGGLGNDTYRFDLGFGHDVIAEDDETVGNIDKIVFGAGITAANIKLGRLNDDLVVEITDHQNSIQIADWFAAARHQIERIEFVGGTAWNLADIESRAMQSVSMPGLLRGDHDASVLLGQIGNTLIEGQGGADILTDGEGNNLFSGGAGDDIATGSDGNDLFVGGSGNDTLHTGGGSNIVSFNAGDGVDAVYSGADADNTLSLGGGLRYSDISLSRNNNDLVLNAGATDKVVFKDWYAGGNKFANLQFVLDDGAGYDIAAEDPIYNRRVQSFDFAGMVGAFDAAQSNNPGLSAWAIGDVLTQFHLSGSDGSALGGDLAYWYARNGALTGIGVAAAQQVIGAPGFGAEAQALREFSGLQDGLVRLS